MLKTLPLPLLLALAAVAVLTGRGGPAQAQPANDGFANVIAIPGPLPYGNTQSTTGATTEVGEPGDEFACFLIGATVWYKYTPSASATLTVDTFGSDFWTYLAVYRGPAFASFGDLTLMGCKYGGDGFAGTELVFSGTAGPTYYFQVGGFAGDTGELVFNLGVEPGPQAAGTIALPPGAFPTAWSTTWAATDSSCTTTPPTPCW